MTKLFLSQSQFGRRHGVSRVAVSTWKTRGLLVLAPDGKRIDVAASEKLLVERPAKYRGGSAKALHDGADPSLADSQRRKEAAQASLAEIKLAEASGKLIEVDKVRAAWAGIMRGVRQFVLGIPGAAAFEIPVLTATDRGILERICADGLTDCAMERGFDFTPDGKLGEANGDEPGEAAGEVDQ
jgi:phage terminase Nu1 subunit (DNA packaging protein)